jgi:D-xylose 1-dehydrogenase (NADP+, D-xylono-1,5-lactone-forming)
VRRAYLPGPGQRLELHDVPVPEPGPGEVLVRLSVATVCSQTDLGIIAGAHPPHDCALAGMLPHELRAFRGGPDPLDDAYPGARFEGRPFPAAMGHEGAGTVAALGAAANSPAALVFPDEPLHQGDRVATYNVHGAYADYAVVAAGNAVRLPARVSDDEGSLLEPVMASFNCLKRCWSIRPAETVAILGQGCQGLMATQVAKALGARRVMVSEPRAHQRELALRLGADEAFDPAATRFVDEVMGRTDGRGVDLVVECVGAQETIRVAPYLVRRGGLLAQIGAATSPVTFDYGYVHFKHFIVVPTDPFRTLRQIAGQVRELLLLLEERRIRLSPLITHRFALERINDAFDLVRAGGAVSKVAIDIAGGTARRRRVRATRACTGWGVLGPGRVATRHFMPALAAADRGRLVAVGSRRRERADHSYEEVLARPDVAAVYIALPNAMHHDWILRSLAAGKHVLCEKPLVLSCEQLDEVARAVAASGRAVMEAFRYRFHPQYAGGEWRRALDSVGRPRAAHAGASFVLRDDRDIRARAALGGGALWDLGCYCLSLLTWQFGEPATLRALGADGGGVDRSGCAILGWPSGLEATASWSFTAARAQRFTLVGDRGELDLYHPFWERGPARLRSSTGTRSSEWCVPEVNCFRREIEHFGAVARGEAAPAMDLDDTRLWLRQAERIRAELYPSADGCRARCDDGRRALVPGALLADP